MITDSTPLTPRTLAQLHTLASRPAVRYLQVTTNNVSEEDVAPGRGLLDAVAVRRLNIFRVGRGRVVDVDHDRQERPVDPFRVLNELGHQLSGETIAMVGEAERCSQ